MTGVIWGLNSTSLARLQRRARNASQSNRPSLRSHHTCAALHVVRLLTKKTTKKTSQPQLYRLCAPSPSAHNTSRSFPQLCLLAPSFADTPRIERAGRSPHRQKAQEIQRPDIQSRLEDAQAPSVACTSTSKETLASGCRPQGTNF